MLGVGALCSSAHSLMAPGGMPDEAGPQLLKEKTEEDFSRVCDVRRVNISRILVFILSYANVVSYCLRFIYYSYQNKEFQFLDQSMSSIFPKVLVVPSGVIFT